MCNYNMNLSDHSCKNWIGYDHINHIQIHHTIQLHLHCINNHHLSMYYKEYHYSTPIDSRINQYTDMLIWLKNSLRIMKLIQLFIITLTHDPFLFWINYFQSLSSSCNKIQCRIIFHFHLLLLPNHLQISSVYFGLHSINLMLVYYFLMIRISIVTQFEIE